MTQHVDELQSNGAGVRAPLSILGVQEGFNPREKAQPSESLVESVKTHGVQNPIHIRADPKKPGHYIVIDGERRLKAAQKAKMKDVPVCPAGDIDDAEALVLSLITNQDQEPLSALEKARAFQRLVNEGANEKEIARVLGISTRTVKETLKVLEDGAPEVKKAAAASDPEKKIPTRVAARVATLPKEEQKKLVKKLKGKSTKDGLKEVQTRERQLNQTKRGRKPRKTPIARDAHARLDMLFYLVMARLKKYPTDERAKAHLEAVLILQGEREILDLYDGNNKAPKKMVTAKTVSEIVSRLGEQEKAETSKKEDGGKKVAKKAAAKKTPTKKAAKKKVAKKKSFKKKASSARSTRTAPEKTA